MRRATTLAAFTRTKPRPRLRRNIHHSEDGTPVTELKNGCRYIRDGRGMIITEFSSLAGQTYYMKQEEQHMFFVTDAQKPEVMVPVELSFAVDIVDPVSGAKVTGNRGRILTAPVYHTDATDKEEVTEDDDEECSYSGCSRTECSSYDRYEGSDSNTE